MGVTIQMKRLIYWVTTVAVALELLVGGIADLAHAGPFALAVVQLGYPKYLLTIIGVFKLLGTIAILLPRLPRLKEWAYSGIIIEMIGASGSFIARNDGVDIIWPLVIALLALISWALRPPSRTLGIIFAIKRKEM
jgi:uncharacterized membrane protein YphA (DoxX/SURF4 family)